MLIQAYRNALENVDTDRALRVTLIYDDSYAAHRAIQLFTKLILENQLEMTLLANSWRFDLLSNSATQQDATVDALGAHLLAISASGPGFPRPARSWFENLLSKLNPERIGIVALLGAADRPDEANSERLTFLKNATTTAGIEFFAPQLSPVEHAWNADKFVSHQTSHPANGFAPFPLGATPTLHAAPSTRGYYHWGINE